MYRKIIRYRQTSGTGINVLIFKVKNMYKRKTAEDLDCGLYITMKVFGAKWKPCIIDAIARGARRPSEIHKQITSTTPRVLDMQLRELLDFGIVTREHKGGYPLYAEYYLTVLGESILPLLQQMSAWGEANKAFVKERTLLLQELKYNDRPIVNSAAVTETHTDAVCHPA